MEYMGNQQYWDQKFCLRTGQLPPEQLLTEELSLFAGKHTVLDLACGDGRNALYLAGQGFQVTAVDFSSSGLERLKGFAAQERLHISTKQMDLSSPEGLEQLGRYDVILCNHYRLLSKTAERLKEHLEQDGILWINGFAECSPDNPSIQPRDLIDRQDYLDAGYQLLSVKEYPVGERHFVRLILSQTDSFAGNQEKC
ncbi:methyltransferase domain-containing protein [uncultured Negativibacillus sp.]|uniref:class I SAM-dependent methyltransferase n=1 Tax=uncultured Negativibacillus sp. TaxID=1980696 RepID=UPI0025F95959|nr:methyltransferase domain-containing protein [uncultured Negativibacillus sp.]